MKIVDEFTGRIMEGRRWSEGLHQAIEAKEGVAIREENVTLATITLQNYFRLYEKLAGMTGTAKTEEKEFVEIYNLHVVEIPTNVDGRPQRRERLHLQDQGREVERRGRGHRRAPREGPARARRHDRGRDVRVPLRAPDAPRHPAQRPQREGARARERDHRRRRAKGAVTIATNMAGRGVDIKLGDERARARRPLRARHRAPRVAPHRQPAPRPLRPPGRPRRDALLPLRRRTTSCASSPATGSTGSWSASRSPTTSRWRRRSSRARSRAPRRRSRSRTSSPARTSSSTTTS